GGPPGPRPAEHGGGADRELLPRAAPAAVVRRPPAPAARVGAAGFAAVSATFMPWRIAAASKGAKWRAGRRRVCIPGDPVLGLRCPRLGGEEEALVSRRQ